VLAEIVRSIDLINETFGHDTSISMNVAAKQAGNPEFMRPFAQALEATGYPERFMIEVTEDAFVAKTHFQTEILPMFRKIGVRISIDDFGIGYSSLSALADITADEIKIDRSFITDIHKRPRSQGILRAIESSIWQAARCRKAVRSIPAAIAIAVDPAHAGSGGKPVWPTCPIPRLACYRRRRESLVDCRAITRRDGAPFRSRRKSPRIMPCLRFPCF
jgi:EAL domain